MLQGVAQSLGQGPVLCPSWVQGVHSADNARRARSLLQELRGPKSAVAPHHQPRNNKAASLGSSRSVVGVYPTPGSYPSSWCVVKCSTNVRQFIIRRLKTPGIPRLGYFSEDHEGSPTSAGVPLQIPERPEGCPGPGSHIQPPQAFDPHLLLPLLWLHSVWGAPALPVEASYQAVLALAPVP
jgi:hypothetical protein